MKKTNLRTKKFKHTQKKSVHVHCTKNQHLSSKRERGPKILERSHSVWNKVHENDLIPTPPFFINQFPSLYFASQSHHNNISLSLSTKSERHTQLAVSCTFFFLSPVTTETNQHSRTEWFVLKIMEVGWWQICLTSVAVLQSF